MKILILSDVFPPFAAGGAEMVAWRLTRRLLAAGHQVLVLSACQDFDNSGWRQVDGVDVFFIFSRYNLRWRGWRGVCNPAVLKILNKKITEFGPDVIHAHNIHTHISYGALWLAQRKCPKVFWTAHDVDSFHQDKFHSFIDPELVYRSGQKFDYSLSISDHLRQLKKTLNPFRRPLVRFFLRQTNKNFAVSQELKEAMEQNGIRNVEVIYNGVDPVVDIGGLQTNELIHKKFAIDPNKKVVLMAGRMGRLKGTGLVLKYISRLKDDLDNFVFVLIGSRYPGFFENAVGLDSYLLVLDWVSQDELALWYKRCDLVITPSVCLDTFNLTNVEAMLFKKPVIGTCFGGTREIIVDGVTGYVINPYNVELFSQKIGELLTDTAKAKEFGQAGYRRALAEFSLNRQLEKTISYYNL